MVRYSQLGSPSRKLKIHSLPKCPQKAAHVIGRLATEYCIVVKHKEARGKKLGSVEVLACANKFYLHDEISRMAPGKNDFTNVDQKLVRKCHLDHNISNL